MLTIITAAIQEKVRQKDFLAVLGVGLLLLLLMSTGNASISVNGESITGFSQVLKLMISLINAIGALLAIVLSSSTIANEYKRHSSHLIWVRGISQAKYHSSLALANILSSALAGGLLYLVLIIYLVLQNQMALIPKLLPAFGMSFITISASATLTSALSLFLPPLATGLLALLFVGAGLAHQILDTISYLSQGVSSSLIRIVLSLSPDLSGVASQIQALMAGGKIDWLPILQVLFWTYLISWALILYRRKAA